MALMKDRQMDSMMVHQLALMKVSLMEVMKDHLKGC